MIFILNLIVNSWADWFHNLPSYQTFCYRLNLFEQTIQSIGAELNKIVAFKQKRNILYPSFSEIVLANVKFGHILLEKVLS